MKQQNQVKPDKGKETPIETTDTVTLTASIWEKELAGIETTDEEEALLLAQVTASNLGKQSFSITTEADTEALRAFV